MGPRVLTRWQTSYRSTPPGAVTFDYPTHTSEAGGSQPGNRFVSCVHARERIARCRCLENVIRRPCPFPFWLNRVSLPLPPNPPAYPALVGFIGTGTSNIAYDLVIFESTAPRLYSKRLTISWSVCDGANAPERVLEFAVLSHPHWRKQLG